MLIDEAESTIVSNLGWIDRGSMWILDIETQESSHAKLADAEALSIYPGRADHFAIMAHNRKERRNGRIVISAHSFDEPSQKLGQITIDEGVHFVGDPEVWRHLPRAYTAYASLEGLESEYLVLVDPEQLRVELQPLEWYNEKAYDLGYQGILGVYEIPGRNTLLFTVQRDSNPIFYDPSSRRVVGKITLAGHRGSPSIRFRAAAPEVWADDYDVLLRLSRDDWSIIGRLDLQGSSSKGVAQFIGEFAFNKNETICVVARPFSGDVIGVDTGTFQVTHRAKLGGEPLQVVLLRDGRALARDWHSGTLRDGQLAPTSE